MAPWLQAGIPLGIVLLLSLIPAFHRKVSEPFASSIHNGAHYLGYALTTRTRRAPSGQGDVGRAFTRSEASDNKNLFILAMGYITPLLVSTLVMILALDLYNENTALICYILLGYLTFLGFTATIQGSALSYGFMVFAGLLVVGAGLVFVSPLLSNLVALGFGFAIFLGGFNRLFTDVIENREDFRLMKTYGSRRLLSSLGIFCFAITPAFLVGVFRLI